MTGADYFEKLLAAAHGFCGSDGPDHGLMAVVGPAVVTCAAELHASGRHGTAADLLAVASRWLLAASHNALQDPAVCAALDRHLGHDAHSLVIDVLAPGPSVTNPMDDAEIDRLYADMLAEKRIL